MGDSPFGMRLWRLLSQRRSTFSPSVEQVQAELAAKAAVPVAELAAIINDGAVPSPRLVRKLAPALGIHAADLLVIADLPVPPALASAWPTRPYDVGSIVDVASQLNTDQLHRLATLVSSLPVQPPTEPAPPDDYPDIPGALLLRLLRNRNIRPHNAKILKRVGDGPYASFSTMAGLGPGRVVITPQYVTAFAYLLGYRPADVVALTGVGPIADNARPHPAHAELAALTWQARRLTSDQLSHVRAAATTI